VARFALTPGYYLPPLRGDEPMAKIFYARVDEFWRKEQKYAYLEETQHVGNVEWQELQPDEKGNWLSGTEGDIYESFIAIGNKETKEGWSLLLSFRTIAGP
jgi:predicted helicase